MGEVRAALLLENRADRAAVQRGHLEKSQVRRVEVDALVDTGAVMTLLPEDRVGELGLAVEGEVIVALANDEKITLEVAMDLSLTVAGRTMSTDCLVGPPQCEPLVGQLVLERLDLLVDPLKRTLTPRPESPYLPSLKLKKS